MIVTSISPTPADVITASGVAVVGGGVNTGSGVARVTGAAVTFGDGVHIGVRRGSYSVFVRMDTRCGVGVGMMYKSDFLKVYVDTVVDTPSSTVITIS